MLNFVKVLTSRVLTRQLRPRVYKMQKKSLIIIPQTKSLYDYFLRRYLNIYNFNYGTHRAFRPYT